MATRGYCIKLRDECTSTFGRLGSLLHIDIDLGATDFLYGLLHVIRNTRLVLSYNLPASLFPFLSACAFRKSISVHSAYVACSASSTERKVK